MKSEELKVERDSAAVVVHDTITITKTVTVDRNDKGDTLPRPIVIVDTMCNG